MAAIAFPGSAFVDVVLVAGAAVLGRVDALERKDTAMAEIRLIPIAIVGLVAELTGRRKPSGHMVRVSSLLVIGAMATIAFSGCSSKDPIFMTARAIQRPMDALAEIDAVMVKRSLVPAGVGRQMAEFAGRRETRLGMIGFLRSRIIHSVAGKAVEGGLADVSVFVAIITAQAPVSGTERHARAGAVVPGHRGPGDRLVAVLAVGTQRRPVAVVLAPDPVAVITANGRPFIDSVQMT